MITLKEALERTMKTTSSRRSLSETERPRETNGVGAGGGSAARQAGAVPEGQAPHPSISVDDPGGTLEAEEFVALELRDRVVIMLLFDQIITEEDVAQVWTLWKQEYRGDLKTPLWRLLTLIPGLDRELILLEAARVYGIEEAHLNTRAVVPIINGIVRHVTPELWNQMVALRLIPIAESAQHHSHRRRLVFATHDPTHPEVEELLQELGVDLYELRYAPEHRIVGMLAAAYPRKFERLKRVLDKERKQFDSQPSPAPKAALPAPGQPDEAEREEASSAAVASRVNTSTIINLFEDLLVRAVRSRAAGMCLVPSKEGKTEVYALLGQDLSKWHIIDHIDPDYLFATIKGAVIREDVTVGGDVRNQVIERWIDGVLYRFHVSAAPAGKMLDREAILFRVLN